MDASSTVDFISLASSTFDLPPGQRDFPVSYTVNARDLPLGLHNGVVYLEPEFSGKDSAKKSVGNHVKVRIGEKVQVLVVDKITGTTRPANLWDRVCAVFKNLSTIFVVAPKSDILQ